MRPAGVLSRCSGPAAPYARPGPKRPVRSISTTDTRPVRTRWTASIAPQKPAPTIATTGQGLGVDMPSQAMRRPGRCPARVVTRPRAGATSRAMVRLSVNVNKVATLRNARGGDVPDLLEAVRVVLGAGCRGITVH